MATVDKHELIVGERSGQTSFRLPETGRLGPTNRRLLGALGGVTLELASRDATEPSLKSPEDQEQGVQE